jgi:mannose-6-phosphate isomerase-like protein (cupin superfamily)
MADFVVRRWELDPYPGDQAPPHVHFHADEAFAVVTGELEVLLGSERRVLGPGDFVVVPAGTTHTFATHGGTGATVIVVMTPDVAALVEELHQVSDEERAALWAKYHSAVVPGVTTRD